MKLPSFPIILMSFTSLAGACPTEGETTPESKSVANVDAPGVSRIISVEETNKLKAIRDKIGEIKNLDTLYEDRTHRNGLPYHVYIPKDLKSNVKYPMVIFLHGFTDLTIDTHKGFPKGVWSLPEVQKAHPHILFVPRNREKQDNWSSEEYRTMTIAALDDLVEQWNKDPKTPNVDVDRLYLTGFSRGGQGTWNFVRTFPKKFAAGAPLSGYFLGPQNAEEAKSIKHVPIWIFNGDGDKGVKGSRASFKALKAAGAVDVRYHEYLNQGHVIDDFAFFTDGFMAWLFSQKRKSADQPSK
jgi:predicted peptidase